MTLHLMTLSHCSTQQNGSQYNKRYGTGYAEYRYPSVAMQSVIMLSVVMLSVVMLSVVMLSAVMLSVVTQMFWHKRQFNS